MPLYEYECPDCRSKFEKLVRSMTAANDVVCPTCGRPAKRLISVFASIGGSLASAGASAASCAPTGGG